MDVWGLSYGTRLALEVEREFPHAVHSLVLDSALPPSVNQLVDRAANAERAFRVLFDGCAADVACASAYPDLETVFYDLVATLNRTPARYNAQHPGTGQVYNVVLTGDRLITTLVDALVRPFLIPSVPLVAASIQHGDFTLMSQATSLLWFDDSHSVGMFYSVNCADEASRTSLGRVSVARRQVRPEIAAALREDARLRICAEWGAAQPGPRSRHAGCERRADAHPRRRIRPSDAAALCGGSLAGRCATATGSSIPRWGTTSSAPRPAPTG